MYYLKRFLSRDNALPMFLAIMLFLNCKPYFVWGWNTNILVIISLIVALVALRKICLDSTKKRVSFVLLLTAYILLSSLRGAHLGAIIYISLAFIPFLESRFFEKVYDSFKWVLAIVLFLSLFSLLSVLAGIQSPLGILEALNDIKTYSYLEFFMLVIPTYDTESLTRFCSVFDEPGVVGTMTALILISEDYQLKDKRNFIFLLSGLLSFSLFFYLISFIYLMLRLDMKYRLIFLILLVVLYFYTKDIEIFRMRIWDRLQFGGDGIIEGNNRNSDAFKEVWDRYKFTGGILLGYGYDMAKYYFESASIQLFIFRDGLIFVVLYFISYIELMRSYVPSSSRIVILFVMLFCTLYQRPGFCDAEYTVLFTGIIINNAKYASIDHCSKL